MAKQDVQQVEKELARQRARADQLEAANKALQKQVTDLQSGLPDGHVQVLAPMKRLTCKHYVTRHIDLQLSSVQAQALRDCFNGLFELGAMLENGKPVDTPRRAILWLIERMAQSKQ